MVYLGEVARELERENERERELGSSYMCGVALLNTNFY